MSDKLNSEQAADDFAAASEALAAAETEAIDAVETEVVAEAVEAEVVAEAVEAEAVAEAVEAEVVAEAVEAEAAAVVEEVVAEAVDATAAADMMVNAEEVADPAAESAAPAVEAVRGPSGYVESEGGRPSRIGTGVKPNDVDYKNIALLSRFLDRRGRILSRRKTRVSAKVQRRVAQAVKRARHLALLPYTSDQTRVVRKRR